MSATSSGVRSSPERTVPERIVLPVRLDARASAKPPVKIFLGTEAAQFRAERVFVWSIEQVRDPGRIYEIYLMKELAGFERSGWTTGFTNYRFAIPHYAGGVGRAIYNDEDQIYLADPGELFDLELGEHGFLAISDTESSVMLLDCERMAKFWTLDAAQRGHKKQLLASAVESPGVRGPLAGEWNARDDEFEPGRSKLLHYTDLHTQPWRPFPQRFVYHESPHADLWFGLERDADDAGFELFGRERPSSLFDPDASTGCAASAPPEVLRALDELREREGAGVADVLELGGAGEGGPRSIAALWSGESSSHDGVACLSGLEAIPAEDVPWLLEELFARADRLVFAAIRCAAHPPAPSGGLPPRGTVHTPGWWEDRFRAAGRRRPGVRWELVLTQTDFARESVEYSLGGRLPSGQPPSVWVLTDERPGNTTQSLGLAEELGWPTRKIDLRFRPIARVANALLGATRVGVREEAARALRPPWPDLVIAAGDHTAPVSRWIRARSKGRTRIVHLGRKGANPAHCFDLVAAPRHAGLLPHPNRVETALPLSRTRDGSLQEAAERWRDVFEGAPEPRIALLVGGDSGRHVFTPMCARRLGSEVRGLVERTGGSLFVTTSRRTPEESVHTLRDALGEVAHFHRWSKMAPPDVNPYLGYLALADAFVVTGESESMLAEACATGKPVSIYPLAERAKSRWRRFGDWIVERAGKTRLNNRGTARPQGGLQLVCAKLLATGIMRPNRDLDVLHRTLALRGLARRFDGSLPDGPVESPRELVRVAERVRAMMGLPEGGSREA